MIHYLVTRNASSAIQAYINAPEASAGMRIRCLFYEDLPHIQRMDPGTYIFSDLERLSPPELKMARGLWEILSGPRYPCRLLNNPVSVLRRFELLERLFEKGINRFRALRATDSFQGIRFPVFVREENEHNGNLTPLLYTRGELANKLALLKLKGYRARDMLIVEFCDTSDSSGIFRKYSAFVVGQEILPRHMIFSRRWNVKKPDLKDAALSREQEEYLNGNPHRKWLKHVFELAGIEYGRIDYSVLGDEPQVWEINTNPMVRKTTPRLTAAFEAIDLPAGSSAPVPFEVAPSLLREIDIEGRKRRRSQTYRRAAGRLSTMPFVRSFLPVAKTLVRTTSRWISP